MQRVRIGIMGFGRVGRNLFRLIWDHDEVEIVAVSDPTDAETIEYLLRFDTLTGRFPVELSAQQGSLFVGGQQIPLLHESEPGTVDWGQYGTDVVIEASSASRSRADLAAHLEKGAGRVVLCTPPLDEPDITVLMGLNDHLLRPEHRIVSNGSSTAHCAAPILRILDQAFGVERAFLNSVHAYTNKQRLADVPAEDPRSGRAAAENIIPQDSSAAEVIGSAIPELRGRLLASAMNVPVANGSIVDLTCWHRRDTTSEAINEVVRTAASAHWPGVVEFEDEPIVSTDVENSPYSAIFDAQSTLVLNQRVSKTITWFDNHWGYVNRLLDLIQRLQRLDREVA